MGQYLLDVMKSWLAFFSWKSTGGGATQLGGAAAWHCMALHDTAWHCSSRPSGAAMGSWRSQCHGRLLDLQASAQPWCPCLRRANAALDKTQKFYGSGKRRAEPSFPSCLSALCKCLSVVKSRVKAPPCGRSLALAQVMVVVTPGASRERGPGRCQPAAQPPAHPEHLESQGRLPPQTLHDIHSFTAHLGYPHIINTWQLPKWGRLATLPMLLFCEGVTFSRAVNNTWCCMTENSE